MVILFQFQFGSVTGIWLTWRKHERWYMTNKQRPWQLICSTAVISIVRIDSHYYRYNFCTCSIYRHLRFHFIQAKQPPEKKKHNLSRESLHTYQIFFLSFCTSFKHYNPTQFVKCYLWDFTLCTKCFPFRLSNEKCDKKFTQIYINNSHMSRVTSYK